jgi:serine/threonine-protein kinase
LVRALFAVAWHDLRDALFITGFWVSVAGVLAIFGAHRVEVLRQEVAQARQLGQYQLKERLGSGGMGDVYLAHPYLLRRPCAIKLIRPERANDPTILRRFEREVQATATLTHPSTVQIYDYGHSDDGTFYYVMECLPGPTIEQLVRSYGPIPPGRVVHFLLQLCGALGEAHGIGLIHRDIKPGKTMICRSGGRHDVAKLLGFGLVAAPGDRPRDEALTIEGAIYDTPAYISPEQADRRNNLGPASDIYSLGAVAYYMLTGQPPFVRSSAVRVLVAHVNGEPLPLTALRPDLPLDLQAVVLRCLAKAPTDRFPDAQSLENALRQCHTAGQWSEEEAAHWWQAAQSTARAACAAAGS